MTTEKRTPEQRLQYVKNCQVILQQVERAMETISFYSGPLDSWGASSFENPGIKQALSLAKNLMQRYEADIQNKYEVY